MTSKKEFGSFEDIDRELKILKLRRDIAAESLKLRTQTVREEYNPRALALMATRKSALTILMFLWRKWLRSRNKE